MNSRSRPQQSAQVAKHTESLFERLPSWIVHVVLWIAVFVLFVLVNPKEKGLWFALTNEGIKIFLYTILVYVNLLYLIPQLLKKQKFILYALASVLLIIGITQVMFIVFYFKFIGMPEEQMLLKQDQIYLYILHFLLLSISTIFSISTEWYRQQRERIELENRNMSTELQFLKSQINPHFLFNTLNNLYALTLKKSDSAPEVVLKLSEMMRYMLYESNETKVPLASEISFIQNYLDLENIRQGGSSEITMHIKGNPNGHEIAPLLFIPFIENAVKHGLNKTRDGQVQIVMQISDEEVNFKIQNPMVDEDKETLDKHSGGIGLINVKRRLSLLYPKHHTIRLRQRDQVYYVELNIQLNE